MRIRWRGFELPSVVTCDHKTLTPTYGKFVAEPFERGFGVTVGNSLRRILLSSLEGSSVTQIKIHGAQHEFTTLPGVVEDMTDVVLNVKSLVVKNHSESTRVIRIDKNTKGRVTGHDVQTDDAVEVINKDQVIATLTLDVPFTVEMVSKTAAATFRPASTRRKCKRSASSRSTRSTARWSASATRSKRRALVRRRTTTS